MANIKIELDTKVLSQLDWSTFKPGADNKYPRAYRVSDGSLALFWNSVNCPTWIDSRVSDHIMLSVEQDFVTKTFEPAPNTGISELTLLRAIALVNDPSLIKDMK